MTQDEFVRQRLVAIQTLLGDPQLTRLTVATLEALTPDEVNKPQLIAWLNEGLAKGERRWELRTALRCLARVIQPRSYLEIGTRRGWSLVQVLSEAPAVRAYCVDWWIDGYGGVPNPGPDFVRAELHKVVPNYQGELTFLSGNSHDILPIFLDSAYAVDAPPVDLELIRQSEARPHLFDLVTVDGDHTALGAWWDLLDVMPHIALGGAVVFDDLIDWSEEVIGQKASSFYAGRRPPLINFTPSLLNVWQRIQRVFGNFAYLENLSAQPPVGIAVRIR